ncbi:MAG: translocation/assembly module TamB domain-containing protein [Alysiella sp.]|uniref:translocation/assembly module TamB domain-containing protein n=1 Tax=Alysiella sp. TaxID=1872483 RepID=UPI0026DAD7BB|nr:translocation/assembly module TamB domain-containing protein [Alysiella sp.]MDO4433631.1 translocation/assembly module TamB domain-containing protein [Alysiella sp.]
MTERTPMSSEPKQQPATLPVTKSLKRIWLWRMLMLGIVLLGGLLVSGTWLLGTESGLRFALEKLPAWVGVQIHSQKLQGTLWRGFQAAKISVNTSSVHLEISKVELDWQPEKLKNRHLPIHRLVVGDMMIENKPTPPQPDRKSAKLPENIMLPFTVAAEHLEVGSIRVRASKTGQADTEILRGVQAAYYYDHARHALNIKSLRNEWSASTGALAMESRAPFALVGALHSHGELDGIAVQNALGVSGSLNDMHTRINLTGQGVALQGETRLRPFAPLLGEKIGLIQLKGKHINPQAFQSNLPKADLGFDLMVVPDETSDSIALTGGIDIANNQALPVDKNGIPVREVLGAFSVNDKGVLDIEELELGLMQQGKMFMMGRVDTLQQTHALKAQIENLAAADVLAQNWLGKINGQIQTENTFAEPIIKWQLNTGRADVSGSLNIATDKAQGQRTLWLKDGQILPENGGKMLLSGSYELFQDQKIVAEISSENFNPARFYPSFPEGSVNGQIQLTGLATKQQFAAQMRFGVSQLSGTSLSGSGQIQYQNQHFSQINTDIRLGQNRIFTQGAFGKKGEVLQLDINAPELYRFGFGIQGALNAKGTLTSVADNFTQLDAKLSGSARHFAVGNAVKAQNLDFIFIGSPERNRTLDISLKGKGISAGGTAIDHIDATLKGTLNRHAFRATSSLQVDGKPLTFNAQADGGLNEKNQWLGMIDALNVGGALDLKLQNRMSLEAGAERVILGTARWQALSGSLNLERFSWDKRTGLTTKGRADNLHLVQLHHFYKPPIEHNLVLAGDWDLTYSQNPNGYFNLRQQGGDIVLGDVRKTALALSGVLVNTQLNGRGILNKFSGNTRYGKVEGVFDILQNFGSGNFMQAPVSGRVQIHSENLDTLRNLMPIGQTVNGTLHADVQIGGRLNNPQFSGSITGQNLNYRNRDIGIILADGSLQSRLEGQRWLVDELTFRRKNGTVTLSGSAAYTNKSPDVQAKVVFNHYQVLDRPNRRLTVSGSNELIYTNEGMTLVGNLQTDEGKFGFQDSSAPELDDDVIILGEEEKPATKPMPFNLNLTFDLKDHFYFSGQGLDVTLGGKLSLHAKPGNNVQGVGSIHVVKGQYKAYGQDLYIKKGIISFVGPLGSPNLNIRAERRGSPVGAGVEVLGNLDAPRVTLVADEPMSEKDKLSWLILNRASSGSSTDQAALATAAGAFLAGSLNDKIGLVDNFGLSSSQTRNAQTGEMNPAQQVLTFGKQLTQDLYLGYEAGLQTASQSVKLVYQISRSFQAVFRAGTESSGGEVKYIKRFD